MIGNFVTFRIKGTDDIRQGLVMDNNYALQESGEVAEIDQIINTIEEKNLLPTTRLFVQRWKEVNKL